MTSLTQASAFNVPTQLVELFKEARLVEQGQARLNARTTSLGSAMLAMAQDAETVEQFLAQVAQCEKMHKASKAKDKTIPRCWTQAKSNIKAAMNLQLDVRSYASEGALRKDVTSIRKAKKEAANPTVEATPDELTSLLGRIEASFNDDAQREALAAALNKMVHDFVEGSIESQQVVNG